MTADAAACAYLAETAKAYADYESEITRATAGAGARWHRKIRRAARRYEQATAINGGNEMTMTARTARSLATTAGCAAILAASLTATAVPASASAHAARCKTGQVAIVLEHPVQSGGNTGLTVVIEDKGNASCTVTGYPRLGLRARDGAYRRSTTIDGPTYFHGDPGSSVITLAPGGMAVAYAAYGTVSGPGSVRASLLTIRLRGASQHKDGVLPGAPVTITRGVLSVTAWAPRGKG